MAEPNNGVVGERGPGSLRVSTPGVAGPRGDTTEAQVWTVEGRRAGMRSDQLATEEPLEIRLLTEEAGLIRLEGRGSVPAGAAGRAVAITMRTPGDDFRRQNAEDRVLLDDGEGIGSRVHGETMAFTQREQPPDMIDIGIGQHHIADRAATGRMPGVQNGRLFDLLANVG